MKLVKSAEWLPTLTSPPDKPSPSPANELVAKTIDYGNRQVLITTPVPDTIDLTTDVFNWHLKVPYQTGESDQLIDDKVDADLKEWVAGYKTGQASFSPMPKVLKNGCKLIFRLAYDMEQPLNVATVAIERRQLPTGPVWSVRLEFSASKAGKKGIVKLTSLLDEALPFRIERLLGTFTVRRVDPAIDLIGIEPLDVIARVPLPGKRLIYVGDHGRPESVYLYARKKPFLKTPASITRKTTGPLRLKLYERRAYLEQLKLTPPYGPCPVTRAEVERVWDKKEQRPHLSALANIKNPLIGCVVAYAAGIVPSGGLKTSENWIGFCLAAFGGGVSKSQEKWSLGVGLKYRKLYENCAGDLVNKDMWSR